MKTTKKNSKTVSKRTVASKCHKFAAEAAKCYDHLVKFVENNTKGESDEHIMAFRDELCEIVDNYIMLNCNIDDWCHKNNVDLADFVCDVLNTQQKHM